MRPLRFNNCCQGFIYCPLAVVNHVTSPGDIIPVGIWAITWFDWLKLSPIKLKFLEELKYLLKGSTLGRQADFKIKAALNTYLRNDDGK